MALTYVALYSIARFVIAFFRGNAIRGTVWGVRTSQFTAVVMMLGVGIPSLRLAAPPRGLADAGLGVMSRLKPR